MSNTSKDYGKHAKFGDINLDFDVDEFDVYDERLVVKNTPSSVSAPNEIKGASQKKGTLIKRPLKIGTVSNDEMEVLFYRWLRTLDLNLSKTEKVFVELIAERLDFKLFEKTHISKQEFANYGNCTIKHAETTLRGLRKKKVIKTNYEIIQERKGLKGGVKGNLYSLSIE